MDLDFDVDAFTCELICTECGESDFFCECNDLPEESTEQSSLDLWSDGMTDF